MIYVFSLINSEILETTYSYEQYIELLKTIQKLNLQNQMVLVLKINFQRHNPKEEEGYNSESSTPSPPKEYHVETDINEINTLKNIITYCRKIKLRVMINI